MQQFTYYKKRKIAHFHKNNWLSLQKTMGEFNITYKELYKIIDQSRIFNQKIVKWVLKKKCASCLTFKDKTNEFFYKRKWTELLLSSCKKCMGLLAKTYAIKTRDTYYLKRKEYYKRYYKLNKERILGNANKYYSLNKEKVLQMKSDAFMDKKKEFIRDFLLNL